MESSVIMKTERTRGQALTVEESNVTEHVKEFPVLGIHNLLGRNLESACSATCSIVIRQKMVKSSTQAFDFHTARLSYHRRRIINRMKSW